MRRRRRGNYSYQLYSYQSSLIREQKRKRKRIRLIVFMVALLCISGILVAAAMKTGLIPTGTKVLDGKKETPSQDLEREENGTQAPDGQTENANGQPPSPGGQPGNADESPSAPDGQTEDGATAPDGGNRTAGHIKVKGIYVTGPMAGSAGFQNLLQLVDETELNAMVIDIKNDEGNITYSMPLESAQTMGACVNYIRDMEGLMAQLKEHEVYAIARIVCFKDPYLAAARQDLALKKQDGTFVTDANGLAWVNPYEEGVWEYLTAVAKEAAALGFDEIQFDYVRFPIGEDADKAVYGVDVESYPKQEAIIDFLDYVSKELEAENIPVTADVFGTIIGSETDVKQVGQDYVRLAETVKVLCPMVYPSHYGNGVFGYDVPDAYPYETVLAALADSKEELAAAPDGKRAVVRPWLQAFTAGWIQGNISYGGDEIREQIQAVYDAGYEEWLLWNAANRYTADGLLPAESGAVDK